MKRVTVIVPTYNEAENISNLINSLLSISNKIKGWQIDILIVDSLSPDKTARLVREFQRKHSNIHLLTTKREGLGRAYLRGFKFALKNLKAEVVFEMDADLSHNPKALPQFLSKIEQGADIVVGSRYIRGGSIPADWSFDRKFLSVVGNLVVKFGFMRLRITDWTSGYRAIKAWVVESSLNHLEKYSGYVFQVALLDEALKKNASVSEIPINFTDRKYGVSKINSFQYSLQTLLYVLTHSSFIRFSIVGVIGAVIDFGLSYVLIERLAIAIWLSTLISTESAIVSNFLLNNFWSFSHKKLKENHLKKFFHFNLISSGSILIQTFGVHTLAVVFGEQWWFVYKFFIIAFIIIPYSYVLYNKIVWRSKK